MPKLWKVIKSPSLQSIRIKIKCLGWQHVFIKSSLLWMVCLNELLSWQFEFVRNYRGLILSCPSQNAIHSNKFLQSFILHILPPSLILHSCGKVSTLSQSTNQSENGETDFSLRLVVQIYMINLHLSFFTKLSYSYSSHN